MGISRQEALECFQSEDLIGIGMEADAVRRNLHPEGVVSYVVAGKILCGDAASADGICAQVEEAVARGATGVELAEFSSEALKIGVLENLVTRVKARFRGLWLEALSPSQVEAVAVEPRVSPREVIARLRGAGLDSIAAGDSLRGGLVLASERFAEPTRRVKEERDEWVRVHRTAHGLGMRTTAALLFGAGESVEQRVDSLEAVWRLQEETGGFSGFTPVFAQAAGPGIEAWEEATSVEYLKTLAISRMFLDNLQHVRANWETQGLKVLQMALRFGADDVGPVGLGERVALGSGATEEELRRIIRDAGFRPAERDSGFRMLYWN